ncbi:MAG TPA: hypothetical protein ENN19_09915 [Chloroflexi bacterium]|nr:hypothetical protein [Chloroflexota bacterium]
MLFGLALVLIWPAVRHPDWWLWKPGAAHTDLAVSHWPNAHFTRRALWEEGRFPLWRPTIMSGAPFAANPLAGLYYPPNWLFLFLPWLPLAMGFNLSALVHLCLAGASMYALMRRGFGAEWWGSLVSAVVYEASPKLLVHLGAGHVGWAQAWGWLPLAVLGCVKVCTCAGDQDKLGSFQSWRWIVVTGGVLAIQFLADVRMAAYTLILLATLALAHLLRRSAPFARLFLCGCCTLGIFVGLTACQWLPMVALLPETTRSAMTFRDAAIWSLPGKYLFGLLLADHGGSHEWMTYVGVGALILASVGAGRLWRARRRLPVRCTCLCDARRQAQTGTDRRRQAQTGRWMLGWLGGLALGAAWFSLGENVGLFSLLYHILPGLGLLRVPPRAWVLLVFSVAVLAGFGMDGGRVWPGRLQRWLSVIVGALPPMLLLGYGCFFGRPPLNLVMFGVVASLVVIGCRLRGADWGLQLRNAALLLIVLIVVVDLLVVDATLIEARSPEHVFADGRAAAEWLAAQPAPRPATWSGEFRVYSPSYSVPQHVAERYGLALADGVDPLQLRAYADYLTRAAGLDPDAFGYSVTLPPFPGEAEDLRTALQGVTLDVDQLGQLGVRYVAAAFPIDAEGLELAGRFDGVYVYRNQQAQAMLGGGRRIVLANGDVLFAYEPRPVYVGWAISGFTLVALLAWRFSGWMRRRSDGD